MVQLLSSQLLICHRCVPCRDVRIGSAMARGISGGQAKRTNIGIALLPNPRCGGGCGLLPGTAACVQVA
jgi:hypothetical protein